MLLKYLWKKTKGGKVNLGKMFLSFWLNRHRLFPQINE